MNEYEYWIPLFAAYYLNSWIVRIIWSNTGRYVNSIEILNISWLHGAMWIVFQGIILTIQQIITNTNYKTNIWWKISTQTLGWVLALSIVSRESSLLQPNLTMSNLEPLPLKISPPHNNVSALSTRPLWWRHKFRPGKAPAKFPTLCWHSGNNFY